MDGWQGRLAGVGEHHSNCRLKRMKTEKDAFQKYCYRYKIFKDTRESWAFLTYNTDWIKLLDSDCTEIRLPKDVALLWAMGLNCCMILYAIFAVKYSSLGRPAWSICHGNGKVEWV